MIHAPGQCGQVRLDALPDLGPMYGHFPRRRFDAEFHFGAGDIYDRDPHGHVAVAGLD